MKTNPRPILLFLVATGFAPASAMAVDAHHPERDATSARAGEPPQSSAAAAAAQSASAARMHVLRERMQEIRRTGDSAKRMQLIEAQMNQLDRVIQDLDGSCPMMELPPGMMGRNGGMETTGGDAMLAKRLEMMEKRMDMMQMMLQRQNRRSDAASPAPTD
jgi:hypothetical protein